MFHPQEAFNNLQKCNCSDSQDETTVRRSQKFRHVGIFLNKTRVLGINVDLIIENADIFYIGVDGKTDLGSLKNLHCDLNLS